MISQSLIWSNFDCWYYFVKSLAYYHLSFCLPVKLATMSPTTINGVDDWKIIIQKSSARALHMPGLVKHTVSCFIISWCLTRNAGLSCMKLLLVMMAQRKVTVMFPVEDNNHESHHPMRFCLPARPQGGTTGWGFAPRSLYTYEQYRVNQAW